MKKVNKGLVITRRKSEAIWIGENIRVSIAEIKPKQVRLRIEADGIDVCREEIRATYVKRYNQG